MLSTRFLTKFRLLKRWPCVSSIASNNSYCNKVDGNQNAKIKSEKEKLNLNALGDAGTKYQVFREEDQEEILDIYEEQNKYKGLLEAEHKVADPFEGLNLERGLNGVYEIEDLVELLRREKGQDIAVIAVPKELSYVQYQCLVNGRSVKHMQAIAQFVRKVFKKKCNPSDYIPVLEGKNSKDWMAIDLGNIALHIFSPEARKKYDLDSLWALGSEFDSESNKKDQVVEMLEKHTYLLDSLKPAS